MAKFCMNCGNTLADGVAFCNNCGTPCGGVTAAPAQTAAPVQTVAPAQTAYAQPAAPANTAGRGMGIAALVLSILSLMQSFGTMVLAVITTSYLEPFEALYEGLFNLLELFGYGSYSFNTIYDLLTVVLVLLFILTGVALLLAILSRVRGYRGGITVGAIVMSVLSLLALIIAAATIA